MEKTSIRGVSRITGHHQGTIIRYYRLIGEHAELLNESFQQNPPLGRIELDELWTFVQKKQALWWTARPGMRWLVDLSCYQERFRVHPCPFRWKANRSNLHALPWPGFWESPFTNAKCPGYRCYGWQSLVSRGISEVVLWTLYHLWSGDQTTEGKSPYCRNPRGNLGRTNRWGHLNLGCWRVQQ